MKRLSNSTIRVILELKFAIYSHRQIAKAVNCSSKVVDLYVARAEQANLTASELEKISGSDLKARLFPPSNKPRSTSYIEPEMEHVHHEKTVKHAPLETIWNEYLDAYQQDLKPNQRLYSYSHFCQQYKTWLGTKDYVMHQDRIAGEVVEIDYAGRTVPIYDRVTGRVQQCQLFVGVLGVSRLQFVEATLTQQHRDFFGSHVRMFEYFGCVPKLVVFDNASIAVTQADRFDPVKNPVYLEVIRHYRTLFHPARAGEPTDKPLVERGNRIVYDSILSHLRNRQFFSVEELNDAIKPLLERLNHRHSKHLKGSRWELFERYDRPAMSQLPEHRFVYFDYYSRIVGRNYHVKIEDNFYSVPCQFVGHKVDVHAFETEVKIYQDHDFIAVHPRCFDTGKYQTNLEHMPPEHRAFANQTVENALKKSKGIGQHTEQFVEHILTTCGNAKIGLRLCAGVFSLHAKYDSVRLEGACKKALLTRQLSLSSLRQIIKQEQGELQSSCFNSSSPIYHQNNRGRDYYI